MVMAPDITTLRWKEIYARGIKYLIFDKDNTLTYPRVGDSKEIKFGNDKIGNALKEAVDTFGKDNIIIMGDHSSKVPLT